MVQVLMLHSTALAFLFLLCKLLSLRAEVLAAAGAQFKLQPKVYITTAVRFDYDFTNAEDKDYPGYTAGRSKTYNSTAGLEVGLKYMIK